MSVLHYVLSQLCAFPRSCECVLRAHQESSLNVHCSILQSRYVHDRIHIICCIRCETDGAASSTLIKGLDDRWRIVCCVCSACRHNTSSLCCGGLETDREQNCREQKHIELVSLEPRHVGNPIAPSAECLLDSWLSMTVIVGCHLIMSLASCKSLVQIAIERLRSLCAKISAQYEPSTMRGQGHIFMSEHRILHRHSQLMPPIRKSEVLNGNWNADRDVLYKLTYGRN